jgi:hypothetical protein
MPLLSALVLRRPPIRLGLLLALAGAAAPSRAEQLHDLGQPSPAAVHEAFHFSAEASHSLRALWQISVNAGQERVACIGGHSENGVAYITRVQGLVPSGADSMYVSAITSLEQCAPPEWLGTVHTHIAHYEGRPYVVFSRNDRMVMLMWRRHWHQPGVFCILYSDWEATCEAGYDAMGRAEYAAPASRGNRILPSPSTP